VPLTFRKGSSMAKFTEGFADKLEVPTGARDVQAFDDELPGFGIRKFKGGKASYFVKFSVGTQQRRKTLGKVVRGNLKAMRLEASTVLAKARLGTDVVAVAKAAAAKNTATLGEIVPRYLSARRDELRSKSFAEATRYLERAWCPLHKFPIDAITRQNVVSVLDDLERDGGKVAADRARTSLSALFAWVIDRGYCESNPTMSIKARSQQASRSRVLSETELTEILKASLDDHYGRIVRLLILTGQRRAEIGDLAWSEIEIDKRQIELPEHRTKNGRAHIIPLSGEVLATLPPQAEGHAHVFGPNGFGMWAKSKAKLDARIARARDEAGIAKEMPLWVLHDLRRSFVTHVSERGFAPPHVVEALVNHISGSKGGIAGVYNRASYLNEKRQALELWGSHVAALVAGRVGGKVVALRPQQLARIAGSEK
jgi:integrase